MSRNANTTRLGQAFTSSVILAVWKKGALIQGYQANEWRYDIYGKPMKFTDYGDTQSKYGWEVDHIKPVSKGGADDLSNLQPLQWESNRKKGDKWP